MKSATQAQDAVKTAWRIACMREEIDREAPESLPTIFALDRDLHIPDGFHYELDCLRHIGCTGD